MLPIGTNIMLKKLSLQALQFAINQALSLDHSTLERLSGLNGKCIEIVVLPLHVHFYIRLNQSIIELHHESSQKPDTIIHTSPMGLIRISFLPSSKMRSLFNDHIQISGDIQLGQELKEIFDKIDIDWEGHLAHFTGDVVAYHLSKVFRKGKQIQEKYSQSLKFQAKEFILYEKQWSPTQSELEEYYRIVDDTRLRTERLIAHVHYLMAENEKN
ncbi:MAG: ubiquinone biosynthesis accessory factor UbiJ [Bacteroidota bacterium]|nr:ubiquinone biosynthesis accessory factor UbiJ [Bacteroidota bacterium]